MSPPCVAYGRTAANASVLWSIPSKVHHKHFNMEKKGVLLTMLAMLASIAMSGCKGAAADTIYTIKSNANHDEMGVVTGGGK